MTLARTGFIPVPPGSRPGFDHADVYAGAAGARRLYVAHTGADRVDVIDCAASAYLRSLPGHPGVAGVLADSREDLLFTSDRDAARVSVYRCSDEQFLARIQVGAHPVSTITLPGRPRGAASDAATGQIFANIRQPAQILVINPDRGQIDRVISVPAQGPHGLWINGERLFCAADSGSLIVIDRDTGTLLASIPLPGAPDVVMHDAALAHLYVAVGQPGSLCVVDSERLELLETVPTEDGAHTIAVDAEDHTVYAFQPRSGGAAVYADR